MSSNLTKLAPLCPKCKQSLETIEMVEESIDKYSAYYCFENGKYVLIDAEMLGSRPHKIISVQCRKCDANVKELVEDRFE